jgi:hypothetical protein
MTTISPTAVPRQRSRVLALKCAILQWLGLGELVQIVLEHDRKIDGLRRDQERDVRNVARATSLLVGVNDRLLVYERNVPAIAKVKRAMDERAQRSTRRTTADRDGILIVPAADATVGDDLRDGSDVAPPAGGPPDAA